MLRRVIIERQPSGRWKVVRERDETGETIDCDDLNEALDVVIRVYRPDGTPRKWPSEKASVLCGDAAKGEGR